MLVVKRRYDSTIDGVLTPELMLERAQQKYPYKTGVYIGMMDTRPTDPNIFYERCLMVAWLFGMSINVESAKPGVINYFYQNNCGPFIKGKYIPDSSNKGQNGEAGTPANAMTINEYTDALCTHIDYFGHLNPFVDLVTDNLIFNPAKTKEHDYTVAQGWCELGEKIRPTSKPQKPLDIGDFMTLFRNGRPIN